MRGYQFRLGLCLLLGLVLVGCLDNRRVVKEQVLIYQRVPNDLAAPLRYPPFDGGTNGDLLRYIDRLQELIDTHNVYHAKLLEWRGDHAGE